ncbi:unnamed protein product [Sphagnum balticum]
MASSNLQQLNRRCSMTMNSDFTVPPMNILQNCSASPAFGLDITFSSFITVEFAWKDRRPYLLSLAKGDRIPPATLKDQDGRKVSLSKFKGRPLVLYFYPADESQGCTKQACSFRDSYEQFKKAGAEVVGVSGDSPESHKKFKAKYRLPYTLLSDEGNTLRKEFGVPADFFGALAGRQTYVTDRQGVVQLIYNNQFQPEKHIQETLQFLQG